MYKNSLINYITKLPSESTELNRQEIEPTLKGGKMQRVQSWFDDVTWWI